MSRVLIKGSIMQRQPDGSLIGIEFHGMADNVEGPKLDSGEVDMVKVGRVILEAERHGNAGKSKIHLFLE